MKYIVNNSVDPYFNLAFEEYVFRNLLDDTYILLWQNNNTIVVGQHQNTIEEINEREVLERNINVVRRSTGGGAVYHDMGNLNFSFITDWNSKTDLIYERFLEPVVRALEKIGVHAEKKGRNDLVIGDKKISGNAQSISGNRILHHGTLLVNSDLSIIPAVLNVSHNKIESKSIKSVRSRIANISEYMEKPVGVEEIKRILIETFFEPEVVHETELSKEQIREIESIAANKYSTWDWNYGKSPVCNYHCTKRFDGGGIEVRMLIKNGLIEQCRIYGDFLSLISVVPIEKTLAGSRYDRKTIENIMGKFDLPLYFGEIKAEDILNCFLME